MKSRKDNSPIDRLGDFEVLRELGRGGMGIVYEARQVSLNRKVALKVLSGGLGLTGKAVTRFKREAEAAAKLHHTNIVPIYATGEDDGTHFYAMELIEGPSLDKVIKQMRREAESKVESPRSKVESREQESSGATLDETGTRDELARTVIDSARSALDARPSTGSASDSSTSLGSGSGYFDTVARMIAEVADGLDYAHKQGVIHRDIKPSNLLLSTDGRLHINDFGLARMLEEPGMTISGEFLGSPSYMSPEQIAAGRLPLDHRTDIYSLGVVLYELLALQAPFTGQSRDQVLAQIVQKEPKPPRSVNKKVPVDLETICLKAMEKDPDRRYQTAGAMAEDLRRFVNRFAISARRANVLQRTAKWVRRHPAVAVVGAVALVAMIGAVAFAQQARRSAERLKLAERHGAVDEAMMMALEANFASAERAIGRAESLGAPPGDTRLLRGLLAYHRGFYDDAIVHLQEATNQLANRVAAIALLAHANIDNGTWEAGETLLPVVESLQPTTSLDYLMVGQVIASVFDPQRSISYLDKGVELGAGAISHLIRARALTKLSQLTGNVDDARRAVGDAETAHQLLRRTNAVAIAALVEARLEEAKCYEDKDEAKRRETLALARQQVTMLENNTNSPAVLWARRNYFDYVEDELAFERETALLHDRFPENAIASDRYATLLFGNGKSQQAYRIAQEYDSRYATMSIFALADITGDIQQALQSYKRLKEYPSLWDSFYKPHHLLCLGLTEQARAEIRAVKDRFSFYFRYRDGWYEHLFNFYIGQTDEPTLLSQVGDSLWNRCEAHYAIGMIKLSQGRKLEARRHFQECVKTRAYPFVEYGRARAFLKRMERDPNWPPWIPLKNNAPAKN